MASFVKFHCYVQDLGLGKHNHSTDVWKVMLSNLAPNASTNTVKTDITEIAAGNGYTAGGATVTNKTWTNTGGTSSASGDDVTFTASGGPMAEYRYAVLYNDTHINKPLIGYWDRGSGVILSDGDQGFVDFTGAVVSAT